MTQNVTIDSLGFETFTYQEGDTTFLKEGPTRDQNEAEAILIQSGHLAHMDKLAKEGKINIAGPFADDGEIKGMVIYSVPSLEEAHRLTSMDPAVKAGRLLIELHPFWAAKGSKLD
jgi:uncharacterized protein YciI